MQIYYFILIYAKFICCIFKKFLITYPNLPDTLELFLLTAVNGLFFGPIYKVNNKRPNRFPH